MVERGRGGVINVASTAGMQPLPYESVYAATKAFAISFTDALHTELRGSGVRVLAVNPGPVPPSGRRSPDTRVSEWPSFPARSPPSRSSREALAAFDRGRRSMIPGRTIRWFIRATRPQPARGAAPRRRAPLPPALSEREPRAPYTRIGSARPRS